MIKRVDTKMQDFYSFSAKSEEPQIDTSCTAII